MNSTYAAFYGPDGYADMCRMCQYELEQIGPVHGPERRPPRDRVMRWQQSPEEWAGGRL